MRAIKKRVENEGKRSNLNYVSEEIFRMSIVSVKCGRTCL